jgi:hypothetical protein
MQFALNKPLTLLFAFATVLLDVVLVAYGVDAPAPSAVIGFLIGQMCVAGAWLVSGRTYRLARAAACVGAMVGLATIIERSQSVDVGISVRSWGRTFAAVTVIAASAAIASAACASLLGRTGHRDSASRDQLRFPLVEIFGWMIVVALASTALRVAEYAHLTSDFTTLAFVLAGSGIAGMAYTLLLGREGRPSRRHIRVALAAILAFLAASILSTPTRDPTVHYGFQWAFAYLAAVFVVNRLDRQTFASVAADAPRELPASAELSARSTDEESRSPFGA